METLIYSYHFAVIAIIIITFISTICSMAHIGPFKKVPHETTKILISVLIIELIAAFIGVYKTLPELKFDISEKYRFEISYDDIASQWVKNLSTEEKILILPFIENEELSSFTKFINFSTKFQEVKKIMRRKHENWIKYYQLFLSDEELEYLKIYKETFKESPTHIRKAAKLMKTYTRLKGSSNRTGTGKMWASISGNKMKGIVVYTFPDNQHIPTVLEFDGEKIKDSNESKILRLNFTQRTSALKKSGTYIERPGGTFKVELVEKNGTFIGPLKNLGQITVQVWEL